MVQIQRADVPASCQRQTTWNDEELTLRGFTTEFLFQVGLCGFSNDMKTKL